MPSQYNGNYAGNPQHQNGSNPQTLPIWSGKCGYTTATPGPQDNYYQTPPYQSPVYNDDASTPNQHMRSGIEFASTVLSGYPQTSPTQNQGYSGNGHQNSLEVGGGNYYDAYRGWHGNNNGASVGPTGAYDAFPGPRLINDPQTRQALFQAIAVQNGQLAVVQLLLQYPAADNVLPAAVEACTCDGMRRDDMIQLLIAHGALGANPNSAEDNGNRDDQDLDWWRHALVGEWTGSYNYQGGSYGDPMGFRIGMVVRESPSALKKGLILFSGGGEDTVAKFVVYGQVMPGRTVRFVKLYPDFGWAYQGSIKRAEGGGCGIEGQWAKQFSGMASGYFRLQSWAKDLRTLY